VDISVCVGRGKAWWTAEAYKPCGSESCLG